MLSCHLRSIVEQVGLHDGRHLTPPKRSYDDDVLVVRKRGRHRVDGRIAACVVGIGLDGIQQLSAQRIVVGLVLQSFLGRLNLQYVGIYLTGQCIHDFSAITRVAIVHHQCLTCICRHICLHLVVRRTTAKQ